MFSTFRTFTINRHLPGRVAPSCWTNTRWSSNGVQLVSHLRDQGDRTVPPPERLPCFNATGDSPIPWIPDSHGKLKRFKKVYLPIHEYVDFYGKCREIYQSHGSHGHVPKHHFLASTLYCKHHVLLNMHKTIYGYTDIYGIKRWTHVAIHV